jgi:hypothetical protein
VNISGKCEITRESSDGKGEDGGGGGGGCVGDGITMGDVDAICVFTIKISLRSSMKDVEIR